MHAKPMGKPRAGRPSARRFDPADLPPTPNLSFEIALWQNGLQHVAGLDEAGRGALAGPVSAGAVILPPDPEVVHLLPGVRDSRQPRFFSGAI